MHVLTVSYVWAVVCRAVLWNALRALPPCMGAQAAVWTNQSRAIEK